MLLGGYRSSKSLPDSHSIEGSAQLNLVDLAGSERCGPDHGGVQIKEANNINKSLGANNEIIYVFLVNSEYCV